MADFRELCALGIESLEAATDPDDLGIRALRWCESARAALAAAPAPAGGTAPAPAEREVLPLPGGEVTDHSPITSAIVAAFNDRYELLGPFDDDWQELCLAAVFRAAADQVVPDDPSEAMHFTTEAIRLNRMGTRAALLAIADELEAAP